MRIYSSFTIYTFKIPTINGTISKCPSLYLSESSQSERVSYIVPLLELVRSVVI